MLCPRRTEHSIVKSTIAHKQKIAWHNVFVSTCSVVQHLHEASICRGIWRTARKLIVYLVCPDNAGLQSVIGIMEFSQTICRFLQHTACRYYYDHIHRVYGMKILVGNVTYHAWLGVCSVGIETHISVTAVIDTDLANSAIWLCIYQYRLNTRLPYTHQLAVIAETRNLECSVTFVI